MRCHVFFLSIAFALLITAGAGRSAAASFGTVVPIGGTASDIALDESRGVLYIANFGANRIEVMSLADNTIHTSINVAAHPGSIALSPDAQYLVATHYNNFTTAASGANLITVIQLGTNQQQTFATGDPPLGVAFLISGQALFVTTTNILLLDPVSGAMQQVTSIAGLAQSLPIAAPNFPGQIIETALTTSGDGYSIWGVLGAGTGTQLIFRYNARPGSFIANLTGGTWITAPSLLPRVSVSQDGSYAMVGWALYDSQIRIVGRYPNAVESKTITGHAYDSKNGFIYAQVPDASQPTGATLAASSTSTALPALLKMDADNLMFRERITLPENMVGRAVLNSAATILYAVSDSGVMVLPVGFLNQYPRLAASQEDVLVQTSFCNRNSVAQTFTISNPGGGKTDFAITPSRSGVTVSPSSGYTPATITVNVDPTAFQNVNGTTAVTLKITSVTAVNQPSSVRVLVSNPDQNQRGTVVDLPGTLSDVLADSARNRFYILRQDLNQLLVFDGATNKLLTTLRTATTPSQMGFTNDQKYLLVAHNDSQLVTVYDLDALAQQPSIALPGGHYGRAVASSNGATLVLARDEGDGMGKVDTVNFLTRTATMLPALGVYKNSVGPQAVLSPSPNGRNILLASPDGTVMLYSADADSFTVARQDYTKGLYGAYAASAYDSYVVGSAVLNASLVPVATLSTSGGTPSGFAFVDQGGFLTTSPSTPGPGVIQRYSTLSSSPASPTNMVEAPRLATHSSATASSSSGSSGSTGSSSGATNGSGSASLNSDTSFSRTIAPLSSAGTIVVLTTSGFSVLSKNYDAAVSAPSITGVANGGDGTKAVAPGGLISVYGQQMSPVNVATSQIPLPTALGQSCLSVNGAPIPLLFVSPQQINAQLPFNVLGNSTLAVHTPGGISNNYNLTVSAAAPSVFLSGTAGSLTGLATVVRADNGQYVTPSNPVHPKNTLVIYLTGMGLTSPQVSAGLPAPSDPLSSAVIQPTVTLGGVALNVTYAGLAPGQVGEYQINADVPGNVPQGMSMPLVIDQGGATTTLNVRVVN